MSTWLDKELVMQIHELQILNHGGMPGLRDEGLLEAALAQPFATFDGNDLYATDQEKAARLAFGIIKNHPFADGNKRTGTQLLFVFLRLNGYRFKPRHKELEETILGVASGEISYEELVEFVRRETFS
jgi:death-on-curing protein